MLSFQVHHCRQPRLRPRDEGRWGSDCLHEPLVALVLPVEVRKKQKNFEHFCLISILIAVWLCGCVAVWLCVFAWLALWQSGCLASYVTARDVRWQCGNVAVRLSTTIQSSCVERCSSLFLNFLLSFFFIFPFASRKKRYYTETMDLDGGATVQFVFLDTGKSEYSL